MSALRDEFSKTLAGVRSGFSLPAHLAELATRLQPDRLARM